MKNQLPIDILHLNKLNLSYKVSVEPKMVQTDLWWFVIQNIDEYILDVWVSSKELFELYGEAINLDYDDFISKAKSKELNLIKIKL